MKAENLETERMVSLHALVPYPLYRKARTKMFNAEIQLKQWVREALTKYVNGE